jgi:hypothetical protein
VSAIVLQPLFAVPFAALPLDVTPDVNASLAQWLLTQASENWRDPAWPPDALCFRGRQTLFQAPHAGLATVRAEMMSALCAVVMAANRFTEAEFDALGVQARARLVVVRPNGCLPALSLPLASWCALYCVSAPPPSSARGDSAALRLYETRMASMFMDASNVRLQAPFNPGHHVWRPMPGLMAVFPAAIMHEIALNRGDRELILIQAQVRFAQAAQELPPW